VHEKHIVQLDGQEDEEQLTCDGGEVPEGQLFEHPELDI
jgi:hypothetical protein